MNNLLKSYLQAIADLTQRGDAREESYYPALKDLLESLAQSEGRAIQVTVLPKKTEAGNPDFRVWDGSYQVIGYIEAKAPGSKLDLVETSEQLLRYLHTFPNLILTDFYEFRLYHQGVLIERALLARPFIAQSLKTKPPIEQEVALKSLFRTFFSFTLPSALTPETLSVELARRTRFLRDQVILPELAGQIVQKQGDIYGFYDAFQKYLIAGLTEEQFTDLYAQTITYGLFAARTRAQNNFNRQMAYSLIPSTIGILRDVFQFISLGKPSPQMEVIVDDIAAVLNAADVQAILTQYYRQGKGDDPILHFYETFLAEYDPETRERRGVYYTPQPVVDYIVRAVHHLLQTRFQLTDGLADERVTLLDPAAGTLTFPAEAIRRAFEEFTGKYGDGAKETFLRKHILPHFYAFELLMAPYAIGHLKIGFLLEALGVPLQNGERFQSFLTNALEMEDLQQIAIPGLASLSEESHHAAQVKKNEPILVILGNPPYSGLSANQNDWTERLLKTSLDGAQSYYEVDGQPLGEKNPKWLQDDYVKFLRFAQWKIHKAGRGIVAMITNHGYLDNPTFRGMRQSLLKTFDEIYLLNLHGNSLKRETAPDGSPDENVFDIRQGVAIALFVKHGQRERRGVYHADLYGLREEKYRWLKTHNLTSAGYQPVQPAPPSYFFVPRQTQGLQNYLSWPQITEIFPVNSVGIVTARDNLTIHWTAHEAWTTVLNFSQMDAELARQAYQLGKDARDWKVLLAQQDLKRDGGPHKDKVVPILYRPFDVRYTYYTGRSRGFHCMPRPEVMRHMLAGENIALITPKQHKEEFGAYITANIGGHKTVAAFDINYYCPLYLYPSTESPDMFHQARKPNLAEWLLPKLSAAYGFTPAPEEVLAYIYAVFYSPAYRQKYAQELRTDFPRVPFTSDPDLFRRMAALGQELIDLHLLRQVPQPPGVRYQGQGSDTIEFVRYDPASGRVAINGGKYFEGVTPQMWEYQIGGYQVLEKYLKDRKGRLMDDPVRYIHIATAIACTMGLQDQIDRIYPQVEANVL
ncbi:MAG: N-6 DNA methylase [candidate division KSB1 bacterium]|nr:N-6 DNA methylase [candidate division KSB1 bacterium]